MQRLEQEAIEANQKKEARITEINSHLQQIAGDKEVFVAELAAAQAELEKKPSDKALQKKVNTAQGAITSGEQLEAELQAELAGLNEPAT